MVSFHPSVTVGYTMQCIYYTLPTVLHCLFQLFTVLTIVSSHLSCRLAYLPTASDIFCLNYLSTVLQLVLLVNFFFIKVASDCMAFNSDLVIAVEGLSSGTHYMFYIYLFALYEFRIIQCLVYCLMFNSLRM